MSEEFKKALLPQDQSILEAIKIIDEAAMQIVLIVDERQRLVGTATDGDVRRAILSGLSLDEPVHKIMNTNPFTVTEGGSRDEMLDIMTEEKILQLPILDQDGCILDIALLEELAKDEIPVYDDADDVCVVLMLGGLGSRLLPLTQDTPKPMIEVGDRPLLETIIENFANQGFKKFFFSVNYKSDIIEQHFGDGAKFGVEITYLHEDKRMGTAGALGLLPDRPKGPVIVMNGDILTNSNFVHLVNFHKQTHAVATMCVREYHQQVPYGVVQTDGTKLQSIVEKPSQAYFVNAGIYVVDPTVLDYVPSDKYFDMPELFNAIEKAGKDSAVFPIREYWLDIGNLGDLERGRAEYHSIFGANKA